MAIKIFGLAYSTCTRRVLMVLEEKGIEYEIVPVDITTGEHKQPEFLARQDDGFTVFESRAMARYLANAYADKGTDLLGADVKQRATTENWIEVEANYFNGPCSTIVVERFFKPVFYKQTTDEALVASKIEALNKVLDVYEARLANQPYLAGENFTLADISHMPYFEYAVSKCNIGSDVFATHPNVKAWWDRISSRPSWKKLTAE